MNDGYHSLIGSGAPLAASPKVIRGALRRGRSVYYTGFTELVNRPRRNAPRITFGEAASGAPLPIKEWYPTFTDTGHRFLYR